MKFKVKAFSFELGKVTSFRQIGFLYFEIIKLSLILNRLDFYSINVRSGQHFFNWKTFQSKWFLNVLGAAGWWVLFLVIWLGGGKLSWNPWAKLSYLFHCSMRQNCCRIGKRFVDFLLWYLFRAWHWFSS